MPAPDRKPEPQAYEPPEPVEEKPPLMDALTFQVCTTCVRADEENAEINRRLEKLERGI